MGGVEDDDDNKDFSFLLCLQRLSMADQLPSSLPCIGGSDNRWRDIDRLLSRSGNFVGPGFEPGPELREALQNDFRVLVIGAGGLGCELLKDLALSGFGHIDVIDMDTIDVSNLNRQFLFRMQDVGKAKADVAAARVMQRVKGVTVTPHFCKIEEKDISFFKDFQIIVLGLDSLEARSYINSVVCGFVGNWPSALSISVCLDSLPSLTNFSLLYCSFRYDQMGITLLEPHFCLTFSFQVKVKDCIMLSNGLTNSKTFLVSVHSLAKKSMRKMGHPTFQQSSLWLTVALKDLKAMHV
jgi:hypothetical protein